MTESTEESMDDDDDDIDDDIDDVTPVKKARKISVSYTAPVIEWWNKSFTVTKIYNYFLTIKEQFPDSSLSK